MLHITVPSGGRVLVAANLNLEQVSTDASEAATAELARELEQLSSPGVLILAGNTFDLIGTAQLDPGRALLAHARFATAVESFAAGETHQVVILPGNRDSCLAWHPSSVATVAKRLGADVALNVDLTLVTGECEKRVRVEPGQNYDAFNAFEDPRNPGESPLGQHTLETLQNLERQVGGWLDGLSLVIDPSQLGSFISSRLFYRRLVRRFSWVLVPFLGAIVVFLGSLLFSATTDQGHRSHVVHVFRLWAASLGVIGVALIAVFTLVGVLWWWAIRQPIKALSLESLSGVDHSGELNDGPKAGATRLVAQGYSGLVTGYTNSAGIINLGNAFYANAGCGGRVAVRREGRAGVPDAWSVGHQQSWIELEAGAQLHVRLHFSRQQPPTTAMLERVVSVDPVAGAPHPEVVATWPNGTDWPLHKPQGLERRRVRRIGSLVIAASGLISLFSAISPPERGRLDALTDIMPLAVSQAATMLVVLAGLLMLLIARGVRRGQRHAWMIAEIALFVTFMLHVVKGLDFEESIVAAFAGLYLLANRRHFRVKTDDWSLSRGLAVLAGGAVAAVIAAVLSIKAVPGHHHQNLSWAQAVEAGAERLIGLSTVPVGHRLDQFLIPAMLAVSFGLVVYAGWLVFGPVVAKRLAVPEAADEERARQLVAKYGGNTLSYFALRDDKRWFFHGETLVAYAVTQGVALVSPDPIGPVSERRQAWFAFHQFADDHGWPTAVMAASEEWLPIYRATGMKEMYVGDEAVADVRRFNLDGGKNKGLRQAVNRIANNGYRMEFHDPSAISPELEAGLRALMTESRRGEMERGFSMTLGRIFDPRDIGLMLAVCFGPDDVPAAFCQYVPAAAVEGYSLDLMRRSEREDHPNGLTDFVVVETMRYLRDKGMVGLGLNFATMRGVLAGERGDNTSRRLERWFYSKMSDSMQIESLWKYNEKFDPDWIPRYAVYDSAENLLITATAVAKAESWWEIPVVGRFFRPSGDGTPVLLPAMEEDTCDPAEVDAPTASPAGSDSDVTDPVVTEPVATEPVETEPVETEPVETEPVETEPVETDPVETGPVETGPAIRKTP